MNLKQRQDTRTPSEFKKEIFERTKKEAFLMRLYQKEMRSRNTPIRFASNGCDNKGRVLKRATADADYIVTKEDGSTQLLEIKNSPVLSKWTFKTKNLESYVEQDASILVFWGTGQLSGDHSNLNKETTRFGIISPENIRKILNTYEHYNEMAFGNRVCVRILEEDFEKWLTIEKLTLQ